MSAKIYYDNGFWEKWYENVIPFITQKITIFESLILITKDKAEMVIQIIQMV